jgi:hypothetical protein
MVARQADARLAFADAAQVEQVGRGMPIGGSEPEHALAANQEIVLENRSSTARHKLRQLVSPGNRPITFVRRLTSSSERSSRFVERSPVGRLHPLVKLGVVLRQLAGHVPPAVHRAE